MATETNPDSNPKYQTMDELKMVFNQFDANKDGMISEAELGAVLKSMGFTYTESALHRVMEDIDTDRDGFISLVEFATLCQSSPSPSTELKEAFDLYDEDSNGLISASELHRVLNRLGMICSVDDCVKMIKSVDSDGDGNVDFKEFQKMMSTNMAKGGSADSAP